MSVLIAILQGIIQGLTEFLPVSSSGHLSLFQHLTGQSGESSLFFSVMLHLGTLMAVIIRFRRTIIDLIMECFRIIGDIFTGRFSFREMSGTRRMVFMVIVSLLPLLVFFPIRDVFADL